MAIQAITIDDTVKGRAIFYIPSLMPELPIDENLHASMAKCHEQWASLWIEVAMKRYPEYDWDSIDDVYFTMTPEDWVEEIMR